MTVVAEYSCSSDPGVFFASAGDVSGEEQPASAMRTVSVAASAAAMAGVR